MRRRRARLPLLLVLVVTVLVDLLVARLLVPRRGGLNVPEFVLTAAEVLAYSQVSLVAVWLALGVRSVAAPWRLLGAWFVIASWSQLLRVIAAPSDWPFMSTGLAVMFVTQAAVVTLVLLTARYGGCALADEASDVRPEEAGRRSFRFSLRALLWGTAAAAVCMATSRLVIHYPRLTELPQAFLVPMCLRGLGHAAIGLAAVWAVLGSRWLGARLLVPWLVIAAAAPLQAVTAGNTWMPGRVPSGWRPLLTVALAEGLLVLISLMGVRLSGLRLVRGRVEKARIGGDAS